MSKFFCAALLLLFFLSATAAPTLIYLNIDNNTEPYLAFYFQKSPDAAPTYSRIPLTGAPNSAFQADISFDQVIDFEYGKQKFSARVKSGEDLEMNFDGQDLYNTLTFKGSTAADNNFSTEYNRLYGKNKTEKFTLAPLTFTVAETVAKQASTHSTEQFFRHREAQKAEAAAFIDAHENQVSLEVLNEVRYRLRYDDLSSRIAYFAVNNPRFTAAEMQDIRAQFPLPAVTDNDNALENEAYQNYLKARLFYETPYTGVMDIRRTAPDLYELTDRIFDGKTAYFLKSEILCGYIDKTGDPAFGQDRFAAFYKNNPHADLIQKTEKCYGNALTAVTNTPAPLLKARTADGREIALQDYQGKVVYVSFWASWCKPCLKNFKEYAALRERLQNMGVVLLNVSIDETEEAFLGSLQKQSILGINALATDLDKTKIEYNLFTIPAYYVVGKDGRFAFLSDAPGRDVEAEFRKLAEK